MTNTETAGRLREAAATIRKHAPDATPGRWTAHLLPLATWLETEAEMWAGDEVHNSCSAQTCTLDAALAVADAVLGSPAEGVR
jgi:hypothetical protein